MKKKPPVRRPLTEGFRPLNFPLRNGQEIADALGVTRRRLEQLIAEGEEARRGGLRHPETIGHLTRDLLPKDQRGHYLPVQRWQWEYIMCSVRSQNERVAQKRDAHGKMTGERDYENDQAQWVGTVHLMPTGELGTFRIDKGRLEDLPGVRFGPFDVDEIGDPIVEMTWADLLGKS